LNVETGRTKASILSEISKSRRRRRVATQWKQEEGALAVCGLKGESM
jgi:hypothetical protein